MVEDRIAALEARTTTLEARTTTLEARIRELEGPPRLAPPAPRISPPPRAVSPPRDERPPRDLEDLLGGRVLAWVGGVAILAGLAFLLTIAISRGWLGEGARTALAGLLSLGLLGTGVWLRGRFEAGLAAAAVGIAGCFGTLLVAGNVYDLVPVEVALAGAFATGAIATALGLRWNARVMRWLGLLGALAAPAALGALDGPGIVFLAFAFAAAVAVLVWQQWAGLAWSAFTIATAQWLWWLAFAPRGDGATIAALVVFGGLTAALALGFELRRAKFSPTAGVILPLNALILAQAGAVLLDPRVTLVVLAVAHLALLGMPRISRELRLIAAATGVVLVDFAAPLFLSGLPLVGFWALTALAFAALYGARARPEWVDRLFAGTEDRELRPLAIFGRPEPIDWVFAVTGLVGQLTLAIGHVLHFEAPVTLLIGAAGTHALIAVALIGLALFAAARLGRAGWLDGLALSALVYLTGLAFDGLPLTLALAVEAVALTRATRIGATIFAGLATIHALLVVAPIDALVDGLDHPLAAAAAMLAAAAAILITTRHKGATALALLYLASIEVVTFGGPEHTGQTLLSVLWAIAGVGTLVYGLIKDEPRTRHAALIIIATTAAKVFLYDLASLDSLYRVASFIGFGLLLLTGAFAYQRVRPRLPLDT